MTDQDKEGKGKQVEMTMFTPTIINWEQAPNQDPYFMVIGGILLAWLFVTMYLDYKGRK